MSGATTLALLVLLAASTLQAALASDSADYREWQEFKEFQEFRAWKRDQRRKDEVGWTHRRPYHRRHWAPNELGASREEDDDRSSSGSNGAWDLEQRRTRTHSRFATRELEPPPIDQAARMARYIVNQAGWTSVATISSRKDTNSYPFVNIISFSDGPLGNGTGVPYLFLTPLDFTAQDVFKDNRATLMMTLAQGRYCETKNYDPMDPRCARVVISGKIKEVKADNPEFPIAQSAVFGRHPWLAHMPEDHHFFFAKLKIGTIALLDTFGGPKYVSIEDYMHPPNPKSDE